MKISIKMISIATTFLWLFLITFCVSVAYSIKDVQFNFEEPNVSVTKKNELLFSLPISIFNKGYYNIDSFNLTTKVLDRESFTLACQSTFVPVIEKNKKTIVNHTVTVNFNDLLQNSQDYLFNDTELKLYMIVGMKLADVIPVQVSTNLSLPWGAPLYNFTIGKIRYGVDNATRVKATIPISFENHAPFDLKGTVKIKIYNNNDVFLGDGETSIEAPQGSSYQDYVEVSVKNAETISDSGRLEVYIQTSLFSYGPMVISYG